MRSTRRALMAVLAVALLSVLPTAIPASAQEATEPVYGTQQPAEDPVYTKQGTAFCKMYDHPFPPTLRIWSTNTRLVTFLQCVLRYHHGHTALAVDGIFGWQTYNHVRWFQATRGLAADGIVGPRTWNALLNGIWT